MTRTLLLLGTGAVTGVLVAMLALLVDSSGKAGIVERDIVGASTVSLEEASRHRETRFSAITTVEQLLSLPTRFMQREALHMIAGRSDAARLQDLIFEANRVADSGVRAEVLDTLFYRLAEVDPQSAVALTQTTYFSSQRHIEKQVWMAWSTMNLQAALSAAAGLGDVAQRNRVTQALYAAHGHFNNPVVDEIHNVMGTAPSDAQRKAFIIELAAQSTQQAIDFINAIESRSERIEFVRWLADYLADSDPAYATSFAERLANVEDWNIFRARLATAAAIRDPKSVIDRLITGGRAQFKNDEAYYAFRELAKSDLDAALQYYELLRNPDDRRNIGGHIVQALVERSLDEARAWAEENDAVHYPYLMSALIGSVAATSSQQAMEMLQQVKNADHRRMMMHNITRHLQEDDFGATIESITQFDDKTFRTQALESLLSSVARYDPERAVDLLLQSSIDNQAEMFGLISHHLGRTDPATAIRLLPKIPKEQQQNWRYQIAQNLSINNRADEAMAFIQQFDSQPGFGNLQAAVITGVAARDPERAWLLAAQISDGNARDIAYVSIAQRHAESDPAAATGMLTRIVDENQRSAALSSVTRTWAGRDIEAATQYVSTLPAGQDRDAAIAGIAYRWPDYGPREQSLIASMRDDEKRGQALTAVIYNMAQSDPAAARRLAQSSTLTAAQRQRIEAFLARMSSGG